MAIWQFEMNAIPSEPNQDDIAIGLSDALPLQAFLATTSDTYANVETWGDIESNCATVHISEDTIDEIRFRLDLRSDFRKYLSVVVAFAKQHDVKLVTIDDSVIEADESAIVDAILHSKEWRFVRDPIEFLNNLKRD